MSETNPPADQNGLPAGMPDFEAPSGAGWGSLESREPDAGSVPPAPSPFPPPGPAYHADSQPGPGGHPRPDGGFQSGWADPSPPPGQPGPWQMAQNPWGQSSPVPTPRSKPPTGGLFPPPAQAPASVPGSENVGRGLLLAGAGVLAGVAFMILMVTLNFWTSIASWLMAMLMIWLYGKGAGRPADKGIVPLLGLITGGTLLLFFVAVGAEVWKFGSGYATSERISFTFRLLFSPDILSGYLGLGILLFIFGFLGALPLIRTLNRRS